jgi:hypothetical protein
MKVIGTLRWPLFYVKNYLLNNCLNTTLLIRGIVKIICVSSCLSVAHVEESLIILFMYSIVTPRKQHHQFFSFGLIFRYGRNLPLQQIIRKVKGNPG